MFSTASTIEDLREAVSAWRGTGHRVGLVPTMGALHAGHMALVEAAKRDCDRVVVSIFVNPIQFNHKDDLERYPRHEAEDSAKLAGAQVDLLYAPGVEVMYPEGFQTNVSVDALADCLCGAARPGHMAGVCTVVAKLFLQVLPDKAYFGEKDYQQLMIVRRMARDLDVPLEVRGLETVRETDGLALSSRNRGLSAEERAVAPLLFEILGQVAARLRDGSEVWVALSEGRRHLLETGFTRVDYLELRRDVSLEPLDRVERPCRLFGAAWLGRTRLIDNRPVV